jgi:hypothetical protein
MLKNEAAGFLPSFLVGLQLTDNGIQESAEVLPVQRETGKRWNEWFDRTDDLVAERMEGRCLDFDAKSILAPIGKFLRGVGIKGKKQDVFGLAFAAFDQITGLGNDYGCLAGARASNNQVPTLVENDGSALKLC